MKSIESPDGAALSPAGAGFALAAAVTVLFNTVLACAKDVSKPLLTFMNSIAGHNWTTQGIADVLLFLVLGFVFTGSAAVNRLPAGRLVSFVIAATVIAGAGLFAWYLLF